MKLYYLIGRLYSPMQLLLFFTYNKIFRRPRARVLVWNEDGELLLARNWGGEKRWGLPGGGVNRGERPISAAKRELYEEIGIRVTLSRLSYITTLHYQYEAWVYSVSVRRDDIPKQPHNPWEITDLQWFTLENLPTELSPLIPLALENYQKQADVAIIK